MAAMRFFNTAGPCDPAKHYMLSPERRLPGVRDLIDQEQYFVLHAPRQTGKTTSVRALASSLMAEGRYAALVATCETGQAIGGRLDEGIATVLDALNLAARVDLPNELRPPEPDPTLAATTRLQDLLIRWSQQCPRPIVLFLDEIDALLDDVLLSVLRQLRAGYPMRTGFFPLAVGLAGLFDTPPWFNVKAESFTLPAFTAEEIGELYSMHTVETGQRFTEEAVVLAWELTRGQPWLVSALARQAVEVLARDRSLPIEALHIKKAQEIFFKRRDTHIASLIDLIREPRVRRVLDPILKGDFMSPNVLGDDIRFVEDLGLVARSAGFEIANPIYREIITRSY